MIQNDNNARAANSTEAAQLRKFYVDETPIGESIKVTLMGKSWGKSMNLICYFTDIDTGKNFTCSVFRSRKDGKTYGPRDDSVDFSLAGTIGKQYILNINKSPKAKFPAILSAKEII